MSENRIKVGVGGLLFKEGKLLFGRRKAELGKGLWGVAGGHVEFGESFSEAFVREVREEVGVEIGKLEPICVANIKVATDKQYVDVGFTAEIISGEPKVMEPDKLEAWHFFELDKLPSEEEMFPVYPLYLKAYRLGLRPMFVDEN